MLLRYLTPILNFFQGTYAKFGTSGNLLREVSLSVLTAVAVALLVQLLTPAPPSPAAEMRDLMTAMLHTQHQADSLRGVMATYPLQQRINELEDELEERDQQDSLRATRDLSGLDVLRRINGAIGKDAPTGRRHAGRRRGIE